MAGHSKFANIKHRKGAQDAKRAKVFTKLVRAIVVAASSGQPHPDFNPRLRVSLVAARKAGVPKDRIDTAIKKGAGEIEGENFEEMRYEGYAPSGVALIVNILTDNKNRSASEVRAAFSKAGGNMGETGSVSFMFDNVGQIIYPVEISDYEELFEVAAQIGAQDVVKDEEFYQIICEADDFSNVRDQLIDKYKDPESAGLIWKAKTPEKLSEESEEKVIKLIDTLEDIDDVQEVFANFEPNS